MDKVCLDAETLQSRKDDWELLLQHKRQIARTKAQETLVALQDNNRSCECWCRAVNLRSGSEFIAERFYIQRYVFVLQRLDSLGVDNLRTAICQLDGIYIVKLVNFYRIREDFRVGVEDSVNIFPHSHRLCIEDICDDCCRVVRAFTTECCGCAIGSRADKALTYENTTLRTCNSEAKWCFGLLDKDICVFVARLRVEALAHIYPLVRYTLLVEESRDNGG